MTEQESIEQYEWLALEELAADEEFRRQLALNDELTELEMWEDEKEARGERP